MDNQAGNKGETDLEQFFSSIGNFFKRISLGLVTFAAHMRRVTVEHKVLFIILIVAGGIMGYVYDKFFDKKYYESTMILNCDYLNKRIVDNAITNLNLLTNETSKKGLMKTLMISDSLAKNIVRFEAKPFIEEDAVVELKVLREQLKGVKLDVEDPKVIDEVIDGLEIENRHAFEIKVRLYNPDSFKGLETAVVNFFRNNEYIGKRIAIYRINSLARQKQLIQEINKLDSLKRAVYSNIESIAKKNRDGGSNNVVLNDKLTDRPIELFAQTSEFNEELEEVNTILYTQSDFEVVDGFIELNVPASFSTPKIIALSILIFVIAGYLMIALVKFDKYLSRLA